MIEHAGISIEGPVRAKNDDFIAHAVPEEPEILARKGSLFVVADGVGSCKVGDVASREAAQTLIRCYYESTKQPDAALREGFHQANCHLFDLGHTPSGSFQAIETTLTGFALVGGRIFLCHVGDTRLYWFRAESRKIRQLTLDHSKVAEMVRMGTITNDEARRHPLRHVITRSVGGNIAVLPQSRSEFVGVGDIFVLCTDGIWELLEDVEIGTIIQENSAAEACRLLVDTALAREVSDNLSVQVIKVLEIDEERGSGVSGKPSLLARMLGLFGAFVRPNGEAASDPQTREMATVR